MKGRTLVTIVLVAIVAATAAILWIGVSGGGGTHGGVSTTSPPATGAADPPRGADSSIADGPSDAGPLAETISDRRVRDQMRRRLLEAWAKSSDESVAAAARDGRFAPMPQDADGGVDREYIRQVVKDDFFPLVEKCYEELLSRKDAGGRVEISFKIVGDPTIGGIVEDAEVKADGGLADERLTTCMRESMLSVAFKPPPKGWLSVTYPFTLSPGSEADASQKR